MKIKLQIKSTDELPEIIIELFDKLGVDTVNNIKVNLDGVESTLCEINDDIAEIGHVKAFILLKNEDLSTLWTDTNANWY